MTAVAVGAFVVAALLLVQRPRPARPAPPPVSAPDRASGDWIQRGRRLWPPLALLAGWAFAGGWGGFALGAVAAFVVHGVVDRAEPVARRREREAVRRDLPVLVLLLATALRGGSATAVAARRVCEALPGPAAGRLAVVGEQLALGVDPERVWAALAVDPELAPLGRAMALAQRTGAPVATVLARLADELAAAGRADTEDRARAVGVRAAVPLGVCLLPAFLLLGIVPLVASLVSGIRL